MANHEADAARDREREAAATREGLLLAARSTLIWTVPSMAATCLTLVGLRPALKAAHELLQAKHDYSDASMPVVLIMIVGGLVGSLLGWRITSSAGMTGLAAWAVGALGVLLCAIAGAITLSSAFESGVPSIAWSGLALYIVCGFAAVAVKTIWLT